MSLLINSGGHGCKAKGLVTVEEFKNKKPGDLVELDDYTIVLTSEEKCLPEGWSIQYTPKRGGYIYYLDPDRNPVHPRDIRSILRDMGLQLPAAEILTGSVPSVPGSALSVGSGASTATSGFALSPAAQGQPAAALAPVAPAPAPAVQQQPAAPGQLPPLPYDATFFERQESLGCGRHSLNNLFGGRYFIATQGPAYTLDEVKAAGLTISTQNPLDLQRLCKYLHSIGLYPGESLDDACLSYENYDLSVLTAALQVSGFHIDEFKRLDETFQPQADDLGYIVNRGDLPFGSLPKPIQDEITKNIQATWALITALPEYKALTQDQRKNYEVEFLEASTKPPALKHFVCLRRENRFHYKDSLSREQPYYASMTDYFHTLPNEDIRIGTVKQRTVQQLDLITTALEIQSGVPLVRPDAELEAALAASLAPAAQVAPAAPAGGAASPVQAAKPEHNLEQLNEILTLPADPEFIMQLKSKYLSYTDPKDKSAFIDLIKTIKLLKEKGVTIPLLASDGNTATLHWKNIMLDKDLIQLFKEGNQLPGEKEPTAVTGQKIIATIKKDGAPKGAVTIGRFILSNTNTQFRTALLGATSVKGLVNSELGKLNFILRGTVKGILYPGGMGGRTRRRPRRHGRKNPPQT